MGGGWGPVDFRMGFGGEGRKGKGREGGRGKAVEGEDGGIEDQ